MKVVASTGTLTPFDMTIFGSGFSDGAILWWRDAALGNSITLSFDAPEAGRFHVVGYFAKAKDYGISQLSINDQESVTVDCYDPQVVPSGPTDLGTFMVRRIAW